jgi:hypothetical protein
MPVQFAAHPATDNRMQSGLAVCVARRASWKHWCETHKNEMYAGPHQACDVNTVLHSPVYCTVAHEHWSLLGLQQTKHQDSTINMYIVVCFNV